MKYFTGKVAVPYLLFMGYSHPGSAANGTVDCDSLVAANTKAEAMKLTRCTPYYFPKLFKEVQKPSGVPDGEGIWWSHNSQFNTFIPYSFEALAIK